MKRLLHAEPPTGEGTDSPSFVKLFPDLPSERKEPADANPESISFATQEAADKRPEDARSDPAPAAEGRDAADISLAPAEPPIEMVTETIPPAEPSPSVFLETSSAPSALGGAIVQAAPAEPVMVELAAEPPKEGEGTDLIATQAA
jgi:hypothetical protein